MCEKADSVPLSTSIDSMEKVKRTISEKLVASKISLIGGKGLFWIGILLYVAIKNVFLGRFCFN